MLNSDLMKTNRCNFELQCDLFLMMLKGIFKVYENKTASGIT